MCAQQISTNTFCESKWVVSPDPTQGTHTTIQAAINAAAAGDNIFIREGTYIENLTLKASTNLVAYRGSGRTSTVTIRGNCTLNTAGTATLTGFRLQTNGSFCITNSGAFASIINIIECTIAITNNTGISFTNSNAGSQTNIILSAIEITAAGYALHTCTTTGTLSYRYTNITNTGASVTASTSSSGTVEFLYSNSFVPLAVTGTGTISCQYSSIDTSATNTTALAISGTGSSAITYSALVSGAATAATIGAGSTLRGTRFTINSSNAQTMSGAGTIIFGVISYTGTSLGNTVSIQTPISGNTIVGTLINIANDPFASTLNVGTGAAAKIVSVGSGTGASLTTIDCGTAGLNLGTTANSHTTILGSTFGTCGTSIRCGTGNFSLRGAGASVYQLGLDCTVGQMQIGGAAQTGDIYLGKSSGINIVGVGIGEGATTVNIATGATAAKAVNIGTGAVANIVTMGTTTGAAQLALKYGTADFTLASATGTVMSALDTGEITYPLQVAFLAFLSATVPNVTGTGTAYSPICNTEVFDQNADYNNGTGIFTSPVTGRYSLNALIYVTGCTIANAMTMTITTSNRPYVIANLRPASNSSYISNLSILADMDAADTAYMWLTTSGEAADTDDILGNAAIPYTCFSGYLAC